LYAYDGDCAGRYLNLPYEPSDGPDLYGGDPYEDDGDGCDG